MIDMTAEQEANGFELSVGEFYSAKTKKQVKKNILVRNTDQSIEQIFSMIDGDFILEVEEDEINYYHSKDLNDLT